ILLRCDAPHFSIDAEQIEFTRVFDVDLNTAHFYRRRWRRAVRALGSATRGRSNEVLAKQSGGTGVIENAEHQFAARFINTRAPSDHLMEKNRRMEITEENDI